MSGLLLGTKPSPGAISRQSPSLNCRSKDGATSTWFESKVLHHLWGNLAMVANHAVSVAFSPSTYSAFIFGAAMKELLRIVSEWSRVRVPPRQRCRVAQLVEHLRYSFAHTRRIIFAAAMQRLLLLERGKCGFESHRRRKPPSSKGRTPMYRSVFLREPLSFGAAMQRLLLPYHEHTAAPLLANPLGQQRRRYFIHGI